LPANPDAKAQPEVWIEPATPPRPLPIRVKFPERSLFEKSGFC